MVRRHAGVASSGRLPMGCCSGRAATLGGRGGAHSRLWDSSSGAIQLFTPAQHAHHRPRSRDLRFKRRRCRHRQHRPCEPRRGTCIPCQHHAAGVTSELVPVVPLGVHPLSWRLGGIHRHTADLAATTTTHATAIATTPDTATTDACVASAHATLAVPTSATDAATSVLARRRRRLDIRTSVGSTLPA